MQIFAVDPDYKVCARYLDVKRKNKMLVESAQMMCTALNLNGGISPYRTTHQNHPDAKWVRESFENFEWLWNYTMELGLAYTIRTTKVHVTISKLLQFSVLVQASNLLPHTGQTPFPNCATNHKHIDNVYKAYKQELAYKWTTDKRTPIFE